MKEINFLGIPVNVIDDDDINAAADKGEQHVYILIRCVDADPTAMSPDLRRRKTRTPCEGCGEICFLDPKSYDPMARINFTLLCLQCTKKRIDTEEGAAHGG